MVVEYIFESPLTAQNVNDILASMLADANEGCTDILACNYDAEATVDDGSCEYAEENFDCDGNCIVEEDCLGVCGGDAVVDECGECGGDGSSCGDDGGGDDPYYDVTLDETGQSNLHIFQTSITGLEVGDEIGVFDLNGLTNYNDCTSQYGEVLVGAGVWTGAQLEISAIMSVDLSDFGGPVLNGAVEGNSVVVKIWKPIVVLLCFHFRQGCLELLPLTFCPLSLNLSVFP